MIAVNKIALECRSSAFRCLLFLSLLLTASAAATAAELQSIKDANFAELLSTLEILYDKTLPSTLNIRILRTSDFGECDPNREATTCPRSQLWITSALAEGGPTPSLWKTGRLIGWKFVREMGIRAPGKASNDAGDASVELTVCEASPEVESGKVNPRVGGWWQVVHYQLVVDIDRAVLKKIPAKGAASDCDL